MQDGVPPIQDGLTQAITPSRFSHIIRSLRSRNYRLFFAGQGISLIGTWMQKIAVSWLAYRLTGSALWLGAVSFASMIPMFLVAPYAGVVADHWDKRRLLIITQILSTLQALVLAALVLTGAIQIWHIIVLGALLGVFNAFEVPTRQSFIIDMVEQPEDLPNAIALNSFLFNSARLIGPSLAGLLIAWTGEGICFLVNAVSYLAVLASLVALRITSIPAPRIGESWLKKLGEGFRYSFGFLPIRSILILISLISLMGMPYAVLMPVVAKEVLGGGAHTFGYLTGASGLGAIVGALTLASRKSTAGLLSIIAAAAGLFGLALIAFSFAHVEWVCLLLLTVVGFAMMVVMAGCNTFLQTIVDNEKRGRVMSLYTVAFMGIAPFGALLGGTLADRIGAPRTLFLCGAACFLAALTFASRLPDIKKELEVRS